MTCNVRQNTINTLKEKKIIDDNLFVISPLFWEENRKFSNLARTKYKVQNQGLLFSTETTRNDKVKAVPNEVFFKELQQRFDVQNLEVPSIGSKDNLEYQLKVVDIVSKNIEKINDWYKKIGNTGVFWNKLQQDLQIPKEQVELLKESEGTNIEEKLASFVANYSFAIEINITKQNTGNLSDRIGDFVNDSGTWINVKEYRDATEEEAEILNKKIREQNVNTKEYAHMTVPGGTNYIENEIVAPAITPSIIGHANFATDKGIGWFRSDEQISGRSEDFDEFYYQEQTGGNEYPPEQRFKTRRDYIGEEYGSKTRRILEVQSDLFQTSKNSFLLGSNQYSIKKVEGETTYQLMKGGSPPIKISKEKYFEAYEAYLDAGGLVATSEVSGKPTNDTIQKEKNGTYSIYNKEIGLIQAGFSTIEKAKKWLGFIQNEGNFLSLLQRNNNWVTFFVKSIIQDTAKQTITEVQESDVEAKVRELEKEGLLEIDCKGKLKAENGIATLFEKGGKWEIVTDFKNAPTHKSGGKDISIQGKKVEVEKNELKIENDFGDVAVIPSKYRAEIQDAVKSNCHSCIDEIVESLPKMKDYAGDGTVFPFFGRYKRFKNSLPDNLKNTPESDYAMRYYWKHSNKPKSFDEAINKEQPMFTMEDDGYYHAPSVEPTTLRFLKPKNHPTLQYELDWYNSDKPDAVDFRSKYNLDTSGKFYRYVPKKLGQ